MLLDLLNSESYLMINIDAIKRFGLKLATYCAALLNVSKKAQTKKKIYNGKFFKLDRAYVTDQTSLTLEEQYACDKNLIKVDVLAVDENDPDLIHLNVEQFASILASEDIKLVKKVEEKVKIDSPKGVKQSQRQHMITQLKQAFECRNADIMFAIYGWIDTIMADPSKFLSQAQVRLFKDKIDDYCNGDVKKALRIIEIATAHAYTDCDWAINLYERDNKPAPRVNTAVRVTEQKQSTGLAQEGF